MEVIKNINQSWRFTELNYFLSSLYYKQDEILDVVIKSGHRAYLPFINITNKATTLWTNILAYCEEKGTVKDIIQAVLADGHENNPYLLAMLSDLATDYKSPYSNSKLELQSPIEPSALEKLTQGISTILPVSFLEKGIEMSKAVARVTTKKGVGSGFIIKNGYFLTNHHVIPDFETAATTIIQLNYQSAISGALLPVDNIELEPQAENGFSTSFNNDWTIIKLKSYDDGLRQKYGFIELNDVEIKKDDFVNIIQHPGGETKKIALYHNMVVAKDDERVQYLTDTQPGSSGSPVFNSDWQIVALHHAGGMLTLRGSNKREIINEGININLVRKEILASGIKI